VRLSGRTEPAPRITLTGRCQSALPDSLRERGADRPLKSSAPDAAVAWTRFPHGLYTDPDDGNCSDVAGYGREGSRRYRRPVDERVEFRYATREHV
jgi:hypothetical protein